MTLSQIKQQIATLLETEPSKVTIKLTNKPTNSHYDLLSALDTLIPVLEKNDSNLSTKLSEIIFKELNNNNSDFTVIISEKSESAEVIKINDLPSIFRSGRKFTPSEEIVESTI